MEIYRKQKIPFLYTQLPFIRVYKKSPRFVDCKEDLKLIRKIQSICSGEQCLSVLESEERLIIKAIFPNDIAGFNGDTNNLIECTTYAWRSWDIESLKTGDTPAEGLSIEESGISDAFLRRIANKKSCIPFLKLTEQRFKVIRNGREVYKGYELKKSLEDFLVEKERIALASLKMFEYKGKKSETTKVRKLTPTVKFEIMKRDGFKCQICGATAGDDDAKLEIDHKIPLSKGGTDEMVNLWTLCFSCNRGKRDESLD